MRPFRIHSPMGHFLGTCWCKRNFSVEREEYDRWLRRLEAELDRPIKQPPTLTPE